MSSRRQARVLAVAGLYQIDLLRRTADEVIKEVRDRASDDKEGLYYLNGDKAASLDFFELLVRGVWQHMEALDEEIQSRLQNWTLDRLGRIEKAILRLGCYELRHREEIPNEVSINEMVELSKMFCDVKSKDLVNGVLDAIASS